MINYNDKPLVCRDCGAEFMFTASEQEFYSQKGFTNDPGRCPECRAVRKAQRGGYSGGRSAGGDRGYNRAPRQMYSVVCDACGQQAEVPFEPTSGKPVYCSECFQQRRPARY